MEISGARQIKNHGITCQIVRSRAKTRHLPLNGRVVGSARLDGDLSLINEKGEAVVACGVGSRGGASDGDVDRSSGESSVDTAGRPREKQWQRSKAGL